MNSPFDSSLNLPEAYWKGIILGLSLGVILFTVWCLTHGITTIFMHLYYFPIVLLAYRYRWRGFGLATLLALAYLVLVIAFDPGQWDVITGAFYRSLVFVGIAAVIAYLSDRLGKAQDTLRQSSEIKERYISLAPAIILVLDRDGTITFLNKKGCEILDCIPEEVTGKSWSDQFLPEKERERINSVFSQLLAGQVEPNRVIENLVLTGRGTEKVIRWYNTVLHDEDRSISGILGYGEDITEEKWAQKALREMQQFQESVITNANVWISVLDPDGIILVWNDAAEAISGYKKDGVLGKRSIWKLLYPDDKYRKKVTSEIQRIIGQDEFLENFETEIRCADGSKKNIVWNTRGLRDNAGVLTGYIAIGRDVTAQKSAEFRAGESSRFLGAMINTLPIPVFFKDNGGKYLGCNPLFEEYLGLKQDQILGKTAYDIAPKDLADRYTAADRQILDNPVPQNYETQVQYADGTRHDVLFYKAPFFNKDGSIGGLIGAYLDITERKTMESRLALQNAQMSLAQQMAKIGYWSFDIASGKPEWSEVMFTVFGQDPQNGVPHYTRHQDFIHPDDWEMFDKAVQGAIAGTPYDLEIRVIFPDQSIHYILTQGYPRRDSAGRITELFGTSQDITERRQVEEALQASGREWQTTFDAINDVVYLLDDKSRIVRHNRAFETFIGKSASEVDGRYCYEIMHGTGYPIEGCPNVRAQVSRQRESLELHIDNRWFIASVDPIIDENGSITGAVHLITDITERKRAEAVMQESEEKYRVLFTQMTEGSALHEILYDDSGNPVDYRIIDVNPAFERIIGLKRENVIGKTGREAYGVEVSPFLDTYARVAATGQPDASEVYFAPLKKHFSISTYSPGVGRFATVFADITDRKQAEEEIRLSNVILTTQQETSPDGILIVDESGKIISFNHRFTEIWGVSEALADARVDEVVLSFVVERVLDPEQFLTRVRYLYEHQEETSQEEIRLKDGTVLERYSAPMRGWNNRYFGRVWYFHDITERKRAEEMLRQNQLQLANAMDIAHLVNWEYDVASGMFTFDDRFYSLFATTAEREGGNLMSAETYAREFVHPDDSELVGVAIRMLLGTDDPDYRGQMEHRIIRRDGEIRTIIARYAPVMDEQGKVVRTFGANQDITERIQAEEAIRSREEQFRAIFQTQQTGIIMVDAKTHTITDANTAALSMIGASRDEVVGNVCHTFVCPAETGKCPVTDLGQNVENSERVLIRANGERIPILKSVSPVKISNHPYLIESFIDLSERKKMEKEINESRQLFADIISFLPDPTFVIDNDGKILAWNRALEQLSGVPARDMVGKGDYEYSIWLYGKRRPVLIDLVLNPDKDAARLNYTDIHWEGRTVTAQSETTRPGTGDKIPLSLVASPLIDAQGNVTGAIESMRDISRVKEAEAALSRLNANLETIVHNRTQALEEEVIHRQRAEKDVQAALDYTRSVIEANPDLMVVLDDKGIILDVNATGELMSGIPKEQLIGTSYFGYLVEDGTLVSALSKLLKEGRIENTVHLRRVDGHITPLSIHATVIRGLEGKNDQIIVSAHDITRQKRDEEAIQASLDEKVLLLREIHHRVKNNLQIIISLTNLQMRQTDDPAVKQIMSETQNRVRAMSLVHEKLYRSESLSRIDFADYTRFLATQLFSYYGMDTRRVRLEYSMGKIMVDINTAVPLGLLMNELISNALKHAFPNGREGQISITGSDEGNLITLVVRDNGVGIPPDFDWQNTSSLGMRLVTSLIDQVDGTIALDRQDGSTFTITVKREPAAGGKADE